MDVTDVEIGRRIRQAREKSGMSQRQVAEAMAQRGHSWLQNTLTRTETGDRPIRLTEAVDMARILGVSMTVFYTEKAAEIRNASAMRELKALRKVIEQRLGDLGE